MGQTVSPSRPIVIDALAARFGGTARAAIEIGRRLADHEHAKGVVIVTRSGSIVAEALAGDARVGLLELRPRTRFELQARLIWQAVSLPRLIAGDPPASLLSWSGMAPRTPPGPVVGFLSNAAMFEQAGATNRLRRWAVRRTAQRSTATLVPSTTMATLISPALGTAVDVVPRGVDSDLFSPAPELGSELLYVADFYPHKRHLLLLDAWAKLEHPRPFLRLIGDPDVDTQHHGRVLQAAGRLSGLGEIEVGGRLPHAELPAVYRRARLFVVPSTIESFCMPLAEAQSCGVPCVANDIPALRETGGNAATYVRSDLPGEWAQALTARLTEDEAGLAAARQAGLANARRFNWERAAAAVASHLLDGA